MLLFSYCLFIQQTFFWVQIQTQHSSKHRQWITWESWEGYNGEMSAFLLPWWNNSCKQPRWREMYSCSWIQRLESVTCGCPGKEAHIMVNRKQRDEISVKASVTFLLLCGPTLLGLHRLPKQYYTQKTKHPTDINLWDIVCILTIAIDKGPDKSIQRGKLDTKPAVRHSV